MVLKITVKTLDSQNHQFEVSDDFSVRQFKEHIESAVSVSPDEQRLIFCGRVMQDDSKLIDLACNEKVIHLVRRPPPIPQSGTQTSGSGSSDTQGSNQPSHRGTNITGPQIDGNLFLGTLTLGADLNQFFGHLLSPLVQGRIPDPFPQGSTNDGHDNVGQPRPLRMTITTMQASTIRPPTSSATSTQTSDSNTPRGQLLVDIDVDDSQSSQSNSRYHDPKDIPQASGSCSTSAGSGQSQPTASGSSGLGNLNDILRDHRDWIPIVEADMRLMEVQLQQCQQRPEGQLNVSSDGQTRFSNAYISSVPKKRRRLLVSSSDRVLILQPSASEAISNLLRRAIESSGLGASGSSSLDSILQEISRDPEIQAAYDDYLKSTVEARLRSDNDYCPKKFEHSGKYFK